MKETLTTRAAAELLGLSRWAVYRLVREDGIPYYKYGPRGSKSGRLVFDRAELLAWRERYRGGLPAATSDGRTHD